MSADFPEEALSPVRRSVRQRLSSLPADEATLRRKLQLVQEELTLAGKLQKLIRRPLDSLETWASKHFPMLMGNVELLVYGAGLAFSTIKWFRFGVIAVWLGFRLVIYSLVLLPAFLRLAYRYFHDPRMQRRIRFGPEQRNYLDVYCPEEAAAAQAGKGPKVPVVIAVMGGAWIMGHRAWNAQLGLRLTDFGVLVFAVDYRNFPLGLVPDMIEDISRAIGWVFANVESFGGDPNNVVLVAQSAGAHLTSLLLLEHSLLEDSASKEEGTGEGESFDRWSASGLKAYIGISGPYDLVALEPHLVSRGIYSRILYSLAVDGDLAGCSPSRVLKTPDWRAVSRDVARRLPPMHLFHGGADKSVPSWSTKDFAEALQDMGVEKVLTDIRPGMTHTFPVIEGPMAGEDPQVEVILPYLFGAKGKKLYEAAPRQRLWPQILLDIASVIMPY